MSSDEEKKAEKKRLADEKAALKEQAKIEKERAKAEKERAKGEAEAAQNANARVVAAQQRRRQSLLSTGAPLPTEGSAASPLSTDAGAQPTTRSTTARAGSMMSRGAPSATFYA